MNNCIYSGEKIISGENVCDKNKDTLAHVFPNSIGGRLGYMGILSKESNSLISKVIEKPFSDLFDSLLIDINPVRDRGKLLGKQYLSSDGIKVIKNPGVPFLEIAEPFKLKIGDNVLLYSPSKRNPKKLIENFLSRKDNLKTVYFDKTDIFLPKIQTELKFDYSIILPALYVFACTCAAGNGLNFGRKFKKIVDEKVTDYIYLCESKCILNNPVDSISHSLIMRNEGVLTKAYINVFDIFSAILYLPGNILRDINYGIDITTGKTFDLDVPENFFFPENLSVFKKNPLQYNDIARKKLLSMLEVVKSNYMKRYIIYAYELAFNKIKNDPDFAINIAGRMIEDKFKKLRTPSLIINKFAENN